MKPVRWVTRTAGVHWIAGWNTGALTKSPSRRLGIARDSGVRSGGHRRPGRFDAVAVELDEQRHKALTNPDALAQLDLIKVIRERKVAPFAANLALAAYQRRLAEQLDIEPGAELKAAAMEAVARGLPLQLIDRDVGITFRRILHGLRWWDRMKLVGGLAGGLFDKEDVSEEDIERAIDEIRSTIQKFSK